MFALKVVMGAKVEEEVVVGGALVAYPDALETVRVTVDEGLAVDEVLPEEPAEDETEPAEVMWNG